MSKSWRFGFIPQRAAYLAGGINIAVRLYKRAENWKSQGVLTITIRDHSVVPNKLMGFLLYAWRYIF